ncbi:MAG: hypothetical protein ACRD0K_04695 [Egibacteraceae bacterium]
MRGPEFRLATAAARFCCLLAAPALIGGWWAAGGPGLAGAAIAVILVVVQLCLCAAVLAFCARRGGMMLLIGGYASFVGRLALTAIALAALQPVPGVRMSTLVITAIVLTITVLAYEAWYVSRHPSFFWIEPSPAPTRGSDQLERTRV